MEIAVIGAGSWGTAIAGMLGEKHRVRLWARSAELTEEFRHFRENRRYLPGVVMPFMVQFTNSLTDAVSGADLVVLATPSHALRDTAARLKGFLHKDAVVVSATKGLELNTFLRMSEVIAQEMPDLGGRIAALSGPNHAEEVGQKHPTATVVASSLQDVAEFVQDVFITPYFRVYTNPDVIGVELGGALKNIIALCSGIIEGLGYGDNTKAALMTRGLAEIARLGMAMKANPLTFAGLSGVGDLIATCTSRHSRNRRAGIMLSQGKTVAEIQAETNMVVEGIRSTYAAYKLAKSYGIEMPITEQAYLVLYENKPPRDAVLELMIRGRTHEVEEVAIEQPGDGIW